MIIGSLSQNSGDIAHRPDLEKLKACAALSTVKHRKALYVESINNGVDFDVMIETSLVCMYAKCGDVVDSRKVFD